MRYFFVVLVLMALSFGGGFWWEHGRARSAEKKLGIATSQLIHATTTARLSALEDQLLTLLEDTADKNYGDAAAVSTKFFDAVSGELAQAHEPYVKSAMQSILAQRDQVTSELAKGDPAAHDAFVQMSTTLHHAVTGLVQESAGGGS